jgi:putative lipoic acid-binding regulatory protein
MWRGAAPVRPAAGVRALQRYKQELAGTPWQTGGAEFPSTTVRVLGRPQPAFAARCTHRAAPRALGPERVSERLSAQGNFLSISYQLRAESRAQIEALVSELQGCEGVLMLI